MRELVIPDELYALANAVFVHVYQKKYAFGLGAKEILDQIKNIRATASKNIFKTVWESCKNLIVSTCGTANCVLYNMLFFWISFPECFPVSIKDAVKFYSFTTFMDELNKNCDCENLILNLIMMILRTLFLSIMV